MKLDDLVNRLGEIVGDQFKSFEERLFKVEKRAPEKGEKGDAGPKGEKGERGDKGDAGPQGPQGDRGERGEKGDQGPRGERGEKGDTGPQGIAGEKGERGDRGIDGARGEKGDPGSAGGHGQSAYALALEKGFAGSEREWLESLRGAHGKDGRDGRDGKDGRDGRDGEPGRDAAAIQVLDSIDEVKSYPRGTFAKHRHGFWYAASQTQGMSGWTCVARGLAEPPKVELREFRNFSISFPLSDGEEYKYEFNLPVILNRGIYEEGRVYTLGDQVQWAGCQWIAIVEKATNRPMFHLPPGMQESERHWQLAVKKGDKGDSKK